MSTETRDMGIWNQRYSGAPTTLCQCWQTWVQGAGGPIESTDPGSFLPGGVPILEMLTFEEPRDHR